MLRDTTQAALLEIVKSNEIPYGFNKSENMLQIKDCESRIIFRPVDGFERLRGTNLAWFGLDELTYTPEEAWLRLEGRLRDPKASRLCGFGVWTPKGFDWVYQRFISDPKPGYEAVLAKPLENRFLLKSAPDFYERLRKSYDEQFYQQEALGQYVNLSGSLVYHGFARREHVRPMSVERRAPLLWALDFNVDPMSSVVVQVIGGEVRVLDEIVLRHASTRDACEQFQARFGNHEAGIVVYGDASGRAAKTSGLSDYEAIREYFRETRIETRYRVPKSNPPVRARVAAVNGKLKAANGVVRLWVDPKCRELIKDFEQVGYQEDSNEVDKDKDRRRTHLSDALGYLVWQELRPLVLVGEQGRRLL
jgi:hypothetical protein